MPSIEIGEDQAVFLAMLAEDLAADHAGAYSTVTDRDALQFLIDRYQAADASAAPATGAARGDTGPVDQDSGASRLDAMMNLLSAHEDRWEQVDADQGKYAVTLPDGSVEHVRTKDDVKAVIFKHY